MNWPYVQNFNMPTVDNLSNSKTSSNTFMVYGLSVSLGLYPKVLVNSRRNVLYTLFFNYINVITSQLNTYRSSL